MTSSDENVDLTPTLDEVDQGDLVSPQDVAVQAEKVRKKAELTQSSTQALLSYLQSQEIRESVLDIEYPPGFDELLNDPTFLEVVTNVMEVAAKYQHGDVHIGDIDKDVMMLAAWQMQLGPRVGYVTAQMKHAESTLKLVIARYMIKAREYQEENPIRLTGPLLQGIANQAAEEVRIYWGRYLALAETFKALYFATRQLIETMDHAAARLAHERRLPQGG